MDKSYDYLKSLLSDNEYVVIALSGGTDSMALLHLLIRLREEKNINIVCAHVNHNLRVESEDEKIFVENYCKENNLIFEYMKIENYENGFNENVARKKRYIFFDNIVNKYKSKYLLTAHHGDDLIETILMRISRGSNLKGYSGFGIISDRKNYKLVKPLIYYTKDDIELYLKENNIPYVIDNTNLKDEYTRNRYRHNILPFLKEENRNVHLKYLKFGETLEKYDNYINSVVNSVFEKVYSNNVLNITEYLKLEGLIKERVLNKILYCIYGDDITLIGDNNIIEINKLINSKKPNLSCELPNNIIIVKEYDKLSFNENVCSNKDYCKELVNGLEIENGIFEFLDSEDSNSNYICRLDSNDIDMPLYVRNRKNGDFIEIKNMNGKKKVKDIFIDEKIPYNKRNNIPIVVDSNDNIIWIPGVKKSKYNKDKTEKCDIIIRYAIKEEK